MTGSVKRIVTGSALYEPVRQWRVRRAQAGALRAWERGERPVPPPPVVKQHTLLEYAQRYGLQTFVETGTYYGDTTEAMRSHFDRVYSIELSDELFARASRRFRNAPDVELLHGDSGEVLPRVVRHLDEPALFWLDGHYSGGETARGTDETPVLAEVRCVLESPVRGHVMVIDDARLFGTDPAYPTLEELGSVINAVRPGLVIVVENDSIRVTPRREPLE